MLQADLFCFFGLFCSHLSDHKHRFHRHHSSGSLHGSFNHNHVQDTNQPLVAEEHDEHSEHKGPVYDPKQDVFVSLFVSFPPSVCSVFVAKVLQLTLFAQLV